MSNEEALTNVYNYEKGSFEEKLDYYDFFLMQSNLKIFYDVYKDWEVISLIQYNWTAKQVGNFLISNLEEWVNFYNEVFLDYAHDLNEIQCLMDSFEEMYNFLFMEDFHLKLNFLNREHTMTRLLSLKFISDILDWRKLFFKINYEVYSRKRIIFKNLNFVFDFNESFMNVGLVIYDYEYYEMRFFSTLDWDNIWLYKKYMLEENKVYFMDSYVYLQEFFLHHYLKEKSISFFVELNGETVVRKLNKEIEKGISSYTNGKLICYYLHLLLLCNSVNILANFKWKRLYNEPRLSAVVMNAIVDVLVAFDMVIYIRALHMRILNLNFKRELEIMFDVYSLFILKKNYPYFIDFAFKELINNMENIIGESELLFCVKIGIKDLIGVEKKQFNYVFSRNNSLKGLVFNFISWNVANPMSEFYESRKSLR